MIQNWLTRIDQNKQWLGLHSWILLGLTIAMAVVSSLFTINGYLSHPQHEHFEDFAYLYGKIMEHPNKIWYFVFFGVDAIWAPVLLLWGMHILLRLKGSAEESLEVRAPEEEENRTPYGDFVPSIYLITIVIAYSFDFLEGILYVSNSPAILPIVVGIKKVFYLFSVLLLIYGIGKYWTLMPNKKSCQQKAIRTFFSSSYLSILTIVIIGGLLTLIPQGNTVVVHWLNSPFNLLVSFILIAFLALVVSHFPAYFEARSKSIRDYVHWKMYEGIPLLKWFVRHTGFGFVYYETSPVPIDSDPCRTTTHPFNPFVRVMRHHLGTLVILSLMYAVLFAANNIFKFPIPPAFVFLVLLLAIIYYRRLARWASGREKVARVFYSSLFLTLVTIGATMIISEIHGWSQLLVGFVLASLLGVLVTYLSFRVLRKRIFEKGNKSLVITMGLFGWATLVVLFVANFNLGFVERSMSPVTLLLLYLINLYGLVSVLTKHVQFYFDHRHRRFNQLRFVIPLLPLFLLFWIGLKKPLTNTLHYLERVEEHPHMVVTFDQFKQDVKRSFSQSEDSVYLMGTSYGGGLMADLWVMLVLNELQQETKGKLLKRTLNLSSNSGGSIGIGNYTNMHYYTDSKSGAADERYEAMAKRIDQIGRFNHLSMDLTYLLGADLVRELIPGDWSGRDRSYEAMCRYAQLTGDQEALANDVLSFRHGWKRVYQKEGYYPSLVVATTAVNGNLGNCFSLDMPPQEWSDVFRGISNLLDIEDCLDGKSLSYYGALSSSNRFPLFSPVASIQGEGHFVDGGYYDNSGLKNSLELLDHFLKEGVIPDTSKIRYYIIHNSKSKYILHVLKEWVERYKKEKPVGQLSAILQTATTIDKVSKHLEYRADQYNRVRIFLPLKFSYEDVVNVLGGEPICPWLVAEAVERNNELIDQTLDSAAKYSEYEAYWGCVEPPTARLLSKPGVEYEKAMVQFHPGVRCQVRAIKSWFDPLSSNNEDCRGIFVSMDTECTCN